MASSATAVTATAIMRAFDVGPLGGARVAPGEPNPLEPSEPMEPV